MTFFDKNTLLMATPKHIVIWNYSNPLARAKKSFCLTSIATSPFKASTKFQRQSLS